MPIFFCCFLNIGLLTYIVGFGLVSNVLATTLVIGSLLWMLMMMLIKKKKAKKEKKRENPTWEIFIICSVLRKNSFKMVMSPKQSGMRTTAGHLLRL